MPRDPTPSRLGRRNRGGFNPPGVRPGAGFLLLQIRAPKTRGGAAHHQAAKVDGGDIVDLIEVMLGDLPLYAPLWPLFGLTLRRRLCDTLVKLHLCGSIRPVFDVSSFRPGGAVLLLHECENPDRRREKWFSSRAVDIYLQEVVATAHIPDLTPDVRRHLDVLSSSIPHILQLF